MSEHRRQFSAQFKAEAVQMVVESGRPIAQVARDLGVHDGTLGNWVNAWRREHPDPETSVSPTERVRVKEMEEEIRRLRMENEFLKKPRPSSPGRTRSGALRGDRRGEGRLSDRVHVPAAGRVPLDVLRVAPPGRDGDRGPAAGAGRSGPAGGQRRAGPAWLPAGGPPAPTREH